VILHGEAAAVDRIAPTGLRPAPIMTLTFMIGDEGWVVVGE
jgi:hypothetical protein